MDAAVVGVDACPRGWVFVTLRAGHAEAGFVPTIDALSMAAAGAQVIGVDIPIGLVERGHRAPDVAGRKALGSRSSTLFLTPVRAAVEAADHAQASAIELAINGVGTSRQAFGLSARILEVERWLADAPCDVLEVHPELSFAAMTGGVLRSSKRTWTGAVARQRALAAAGVDLSNVDPAMTGPASVDDVLDAAAVAWSAWRAARGQARTLPDPPVTLSSGRLMAITV
jgi:predicted RNase H-like nuclease